MSTWRSCAATSTLGGDFARQGPSENSDPTPQAKRRTGDCPGPRDEKATQHASPRKRSEARPGRPECGGEWAAKTGKRPLHQPKHPRSANYWAPLTRTRNQREHRPQWPTERSGPTQHAKGRTGDCPGPRNETATRRNVTQGGGGGCAPFQRQADCTSTTRHPHSALMALQPPTQQSRGAPPQNMTKVRETESTSRRTCSAVVGFRSGET